jgi:uncharacterized HAD superfamily protein
MHLYIFSVCCAMISQIAYDLDDVLSHFVPYLLPFINRVKGTSFAVEDITCYDLARCLNMPGQEALELLAGFTESHEFASITPTYGAVDAVRLIKDAGITQHIITGREEGLMRQTTYEQAERLFSGIFQNIFFLPASTHNGSGFAGKSKICIDNGIDLIVEDCYANAVECSNAGIRVLLMTQNWNKDEELGRIIRVHDMYEVADYILSGG